MSIPNETQWNQALAAAIARVEANPIPIHFNMVIVDHVKAEAPLRTSEGLMVWKGNRSQPELMRVTRDEFIAIQERPTCAHGNAWRDSGGEVTTMEAVAWYNLCPCCSAQIERDESGGADPDEPPRQHPHHGNRPDGLCVVCSKDELVLDDLSDETLDNLLAEHGWRPIDIAEAQQLEQEGRLANHNGRYAVKAAGESGEPLLRNDRLAEEAVAGSHDYATKERQRYAGQKIPDYALYSIEAREAATTDNAIYVHGLSGALRSTAYERLVALEGGNVG